MGTVAIVVGLVALLLLVDRGLLAAERRGWIYYRRVKPPPGAAGDAMLHVASIWDPGAHHQVEQREAEQHQREEDPVPSDD